MSAHASILALADIFEMASRNKIFRENLKKDWICRGQGNDESPLTTTLERACKSFGISLNEIKEKESERN